MKENYNYNFFERDLVTVIVPCYNHEKYIIECLDSIKNQTLKNFQWIVVDDGSKDSSPQILLDNKIKYGYQLILQDNKGLARTLNETIKNYAKGKYICLCASDDYWLPNKLELQLDFMEQNRDYAMCYGRNYPVDIHSNLLPHKKQKKFKGGYIFNEIIKQDFHPDVNYMVKVDCLKEVGYYKSDIIAEDFYINCMLSKKYKIGFIDEYVGYYRVQNLSEKRDPLKLYECHRNTIDLFYREPVYKEAVALSNYRMFILLSQYKKYKIASLKYMIKSMKYIYKINFIKAIGFLLLKWE